MSSGRTSRHQATRWLRALLAVPCLTLVGACNPAPPAEVKSFAADVTGYNFTTEGVQEFYVNGKYASNLPPFGGGGGSSCCVSLPSPWRPDLMAKVDWKIGDWTVPYSQISDLSTKEQIKCCWKERTLSRTVPVQKYGPEGGSLQVFFLPKDEIKVWVTNYDLGHDKHPSGMSYPQKPLSTE